MNDKMSSGLVRGVLALSVALMPAVSAVAAKAVAKDAAVSAKAPADANLVRLEGAWIRQTVEGQTGTGGFMNLTASRNVTLIGFATPVAEISELHEMKMDGNVMRMNAIDALPLPAGQVVALRPGANHLMLMSLKRPLKAGDQVPLTLKLRLDDGKVVEQTVSVPVLGGAPMAKPAMSMPMHDHQHMMDH